MASLGGLWWITPVQCLVTLGQAVNFGASGFQTPITMPVLRLKEVGDKEASALVTELLRLSEIIFPKLNAISTVGNLIMTATLLWNRGSLDSILRAKFPYIAASFGLSVGVTIYALTVMVPINESMKSMAKKLKADPENKEAGEIFRMRQGQWQTWNMGRGSLMLVGSIISMVGILA